MILMVDTDNIWSQNILGEMILSVFMDKEDGDYRYKSCDELDDFICIFFTYLDATERSKVILLKQFGITVGIYESECIIHFEDCFLVNQDLTFDNNWEFSNGRTPSSEFINKLQGILNGN